MQVNDIDWEKFMDEKSERLKEYYNKYNELCDDVRFDNADDMVSFWIDELYPCFSDEIKDRIERETDSDKIPTLLDYEKGRECIHRNEKGYIMGYQVTPLITLALSSKSKTWITTDLYGELSSLPSHKMIEEFAQCSQCAWYFATSRKEPNNLFYHELLSHSVNIKCPHGDREFNENDIKGYEKHLLREHKEKLCNRCAKVLPKHLLQYHRQLYHGLVECPHCDKLFTCEEFESHFAGSFSNDDESQREGRSLLATLAAKLSANHIEYRQKFSDQVEIPVEVTNDVIDDLERIAALTDELLKDWLPSASSTMNPLPPMVEDDKHSKMEYESGDDTSE